MDIDTLTKVIGPVGSGLISALVVYLATRRKTAAETKKIELETKKLSDEMERLSVTVREVSYKLNKTEERIIYDGTIHCDGSHFQNHEARFYGESR